jgi:hypothetical protein
MSRADTTAVPVNANSVDQSQPVESLPPTPACMVSAETDSTAGLEPSSPTGGGWVELWYLGADGPGMQSRVFQRGMVRCEVQVQTEVSDDSDTTSAVLPFFAEVVICWRHNRLLVPTDTGQPPSIAGKA